MALPAVTVGYPGPYDSYVASPQASGGLIVGFSRNPKTFALNKYTELFPSKQMLGLYYEYTSQQAARIVSQTAADDEWPDGDACPPGLNNIESYAVKSYRTKRRVYPFTLGELTTEQMDFDMLMTNSNDMAQRCMTVRTLLVQTALYAAYNGATNSANVNGSFGAPAILPAGQGWDTGSVGYGGSAGPNIKTSFQYGLIAIHLATIGVVREDQICCVVNPRTANAMARSTEIQDYLKQSPFALAQIRGDAPNQNGKWGLPTTLYTVDMVIEDAVYISSNKEAATLVSNYVMADVPNIAYFVAKPAKLVGLAGSRSFSTVQIFFYKDEMTMETFNDRQNKRFLARIISNYVPVVATTKSGFLFQNLWSTSPALPVL
jgi:hypothetical protein